MKIVAIISILTLSYTGLSQDNDWMSFPSDSADTLKKIVNLNYDANDGTVTFHQDERLDKLEKFVRANEESLDGVLIDGFRVLIYFDQDKTNSEQQKAHFMSIYEQHKAYVDYMAPNYRVRVGNFRTRLEAEQLKQEILMIFPTAIVVADKIQLPSLEDPKTVVNGGN